MSDEKDPPYFQISHENHSPWVVVTSVTFLVYSIMAVAAKIISRLHLSTMKSYDWLIVVSTTAAFAQTICIVSGCKNGLGQHQATLSPILVERFYKYTYAASILYISSTFFAKMSLVLFIMAITPARHVHWFCCAFAAITTGWFLCGVFALAFQCDLPSPYLAVGNNCIDRYRLQIFIGIVSMATDLTLVVLPAVIMKKVQTSTNRKWQVAGLFAMRIFVPAFTIPQLIAQQKLSDTNDETWRTVSPAIWTQLTMNVSILTACIPSLKGVLDIFKSGTSFFTVPAHYEGVFGSNSIDRSTTGAGRSYALRSLFRKSDGRNSLDTKQKAAEWPTRDMKKITGEHSAEISSSGSKVNHLKGLRERSESQKSLTDNIIMRTVNFEVEFEEREAPSTEHQSYSSVDI